MLSLYRAALRIRRDDPDLQSGRLAWIGSGPAALAFRRGERFVAICNVGSEPVPAPRDAELLMSSVPLVDGCLPGDAAAWWRLEPTGAGP
jgi:alpha-glucosidase